MNSITTATEFLEAREKNVAALVDSEESPPEIAPKAMKVILCWKHMSATTALSMSNVVTLNLSCMKLL